MRNRHQNSLILAACSFVAVLCLILWAQFITSWQQSYTLYLVGFLAILILLISLLYLQLKVFQQQSVVHSPWLHPPILITAWIIVGIALPGLYSFIDPTILDSWAALANMDFGISLRGFMMIFLGCAMIWLGYMLGLQFFGVPKFAKHFGQTEIKLAPLMIVYLVVFVAQVVTIQTVGIAYGVNRANLGVFEPLMQALTYIEQMHMLVLAIAALQFFRKKWPFLPLLIVFTVQIAFAFISGFTKPMYWLALVILLAAIHSQISRKVMMQYILVLLVICIVIVPVSLGIRSISRHTNISNIGDAADLAVQAFDDSWGDSISTGSSQFVEKLVDRQTSLVHMPGLIMIKTPSIIPYQGFEQFLAIPAYVIPRALWNNKPYLSQGRWFNVHYLGAPRDTETSMAMTIFGEGYIFAGWPGAMFAALCYGFFLALLYRFTMSAGLTNIYLALVPTFIDIEGQFSLLVLTTIQLTLVMMLSYMLIATFLNLQRPLSRPIVQKELT